MKFNSANFEFDGGTIGFITETIVSANAVDKKAYSDRQFGKINFGDGYLIKNGEQYARSIRPSSPGGRSNLFIPYYSVVGASGDYASYDGVYLCVAKKRYGEIGTFMEVRVLHSKKASSKNYFSFLAVIVEHLENMPDNPSKYPGAWKGSYKNNYDNKTRSVELSIVVNNTGGYGDDIWLGGARWRFFNTTASGNWEETVDGKTVTKWTYQSADIDTISTDLKLNGGSDGNDAANPNAASSDFLLQNSEDERKYGINIFEVSQPLIRFETSGALTGGANGNALAALESYSRFMYSLLNSQVSTANYVLVGMPWLRPGFNCWVDPLYSDTIYYISEVQQQGNPTDGATTVVSLIFGRPRGEFASNSGAFGAMNDTNENVFVNTMNSEHRVKGSGGDGPWGAYLEDAVAFQNVKAATEDYYGHEISGTVTANNSQFHKSMYVDGVKSAPLADNVDKGKVFNGEYSAEEIKAKIGSIYASAPAVVKERSAKLKTAVEGARKYIKLHYDSEKRV